ncbi:hypothetical protein ABT160_11610 [Streptomyces sp. NPDC001941]|uniref:hypothetical protein n=1 Tax=Streptomyces sp. NPDC001941 TaxID=3154659 RepID=UPI00332FC865
MAKNKNRKQERSSQAERGAQDAQKSSMEAQSPAQSMAQGSPADVARKHQRRFGHN